ncbi:MAG: glycosyl transferase [Gammaproteobacteria bacterium]|nr:glycosyl transferase [Gammaproteobacteria bacterium]
MENVTVIIPTYNREQSLARALDSVIAQTHPVAEVVVVDDGSTDSTESLVRASYPKVTFIKRRNQGVSKARNVGIRQSATNWLAFLDSDDEWLPDKLERQFAALEKQPGHKIIHSDEIWIRNGVRVNSMNKHRKFGGDIFEKCLSICLISPSAAVVHRDIFDTLGLFDESLPACEDYDLWLRICSKYSVLYVNEKLLRKYGGHQDQLSKQYWGMDRFRVIALNKIIRSGELSATQINSARKVLIQKCQILIDGASKRNNRNLKRSISRLLSEHL